MSCPQSPTAFLRIWQAASTVPLPVTSSEGRWTVSPPPASSSSVNMPEINSGFYSSPKAARQWAMRVITTTANTMAIFLKQTGLLMPGFSPEFR